MSNQSDVISKIADIIDASNDQDRQNALDILDIVTDDGNDGTCVNHEPDSWGACVNCGAAIPNFYLL